MQRYLREACRRGDPRLVLFGLERELSLGSLETTPADIARVRQMLPQEVLCELIETWEKVELALPPEFGQILLGEVAYIPSGEFRMGASAQDRRDGRDRLASYLEPRTVSAVKSNFQQTVDIPRPFLACTAPATEAEWCAVMDYSGAATKRPNRPKTGVSWYDAVAYCNKLSVRDGLPLAYAVEGMSVRWIGGLGWRLPTEPEWEYAARAGTTGPAYVPLEHLNEAAWCQENSWGKVHDVRLKEPNPWGLHDVLGLVWEWVWGEYEANVDYASDPYSGLEGGDDFLREGHGNRSDDAVRCGGKLCGGSFATPRAAVSVLSRALRCPGVSRPVSFVPAVRPVRFVR